MTKININNKLLNSKILWTNPRPTDEISSLDINLSSDDYDTLKWFYKYTTSSNALKISESLRGYSTILDTADNNGNAIRRMVTRQSDKRFTVEAIQGTPPGNQIIIPIFVVGYKTGLFK